MTVETVELRRVELPLRAPWRTAYGVEQVRDVVIVRVVAAGVEGWGECGALGAPGYSAEWSDGAYEVLRRFLGPAVLAPAAATDVPVVVGNEMAKAALSTALLDAQLRAEGVS